MLLNDLVETRGIGFGRKILDAQNAHLQGPLTKCNRDNVTFLDIIRCLGGSAVDRYVLGIACLVGNGAAFDDTGNLQKFVKPHELVELVLQSLACGEGYATGCCDFNRLTGLGVSAGVSVLLLYREDAEAGDLYGLTCYECVVNGCGDRVKNLCNALLGHSGCLCNLLDDLILSHEKNPP